MQRVMIIGHSGAGKSTLAGILGEQTGIPVCHIDALHWMPGWIESTREETKRKVEEVASGGEWIIEGNYSASFDARMCRADTVIFLDFPRRRCLLRVIKRSLRYYGMTRPDLANDCPERFDWRFFLWVWNSHRKVRSGLLDTLARYHNRFALHVLKSPQEVREFLAGV